MTKEEENDTVCLMRIIDTYMNLKVNIYDFVNEYLIDKIAHKMIDEFFM